MPYVTLIENIQIMRRKQAFGLLKHIGLYPSNELPWVRKQNPHRPTIEIVE